MHIQPLSLTYCRYQYSHSPEWRYTADHCILWLHSKSQHSSLIPHLEQAWNTPIHCTPGAAGFTCQQAEALACEVSARFLCEDFEELCSAMPGVMRSQVLMIRNLVRDSFTSKGLLQEPPAVAAEGGAVAKAENGEGSGTGERKNAS